MAAAAPQVVSKIRLEPKQGAAFRTEATEVLYGGAAGGGKSYLLRASAIRWCAEVPGIQVYFFRRTLPDLRDNHLRGPTSFHVMLDAYITSGKVRYRAVENEFEFWNGAVLHLCYCDSENDVEKYRGAEIHVLMPDELTHFSEYQYRFLRSRVRIAGLTIPDKYRTRLPRIEAASNPGSIGHAWVKRTFITPKPANESWRVPPEEGGMVRQFIPARLMDNPYLTRDDPSYADRLRGLGSDNLVRAMLEGDWDIVAGQAFEKLRRDIHCIEPFEPPEDWMCFGSLDWGSSRPFSFGMWAVSNGNPLPDGRTYRRGAMIRFNEVYGWNGKPNEGLRKEAGDVAEMIASRIGGRKLAYISADPSMWKVDGGPSVAENMLKHGVVLRRADNSRIVGYVQVRQRIAGDEDGPMLYATKNCHDGFWRTMPDLIMDDRHVEDVDTENEDHCFAAGTMVLTINGQKPIETIKRNELILTCDGWSAALPIPPRTAPCIKLTYDDGSEVICTPDHKFLSLGRGWVEAIDLLDEISYNALFDRRTSWSKSLAKRVNRFLESVTGFAVSIISGRAFGYIALSGSIIEGQSPRDSTFTTSTATGPETVSQTWNWSSNRNTFLSTENKTIIQHGENPLFKGQRNGIVRLLVENGTRITLKNMSLPLISQLWQRIANSVARNLWHARLSNIALGFATLTARQKRCVSVEPQPSQPVYCLHIPIYHHFSLGDGTVVHNCYDETRYACMSRPWMALVQKAKPKVDRWMRVMDNESANEESWRTA